MRKTRSKNPKTKGKSKRAKKGIKIKDLGSKRDEAVRGGLTDPVTGMTIASRR